MSVEALREVVADLDGSGIVCGASRRRGVPDEPCPRHRSGGPTSPSWRRQDPEIADVVLGELDRLRGGLQLIASENFTSPAVLAALGSTLSNKYAEGYPGRALLRRLPARSTGPRSSASSGRKALFGADVHANLQPHSGASANLAAYAALLQPGDTVLAMSLPHGGHLTHGSKVSFSGKWFNTVSYAVPRGHRAHRLRRGARPRPRAPAEDDHLRRHRLPAADRLRRASARSPTRSARWLMVDAAHFIGLVAGKAIPSPVPYADVVTLHHAQGAARAARRHDRLPRASSRSASTRRSSRSRRAAR